MSPKWSFIDHTCQNPPVYLDLNQDRCLFAREYTSKGGYSASTCNQLILNFKKAPDRRGKPEWRYKLSAIRQFASELSMVIPKNAVVARIPTSKAKDDPKYDSRLDDLLTGLSGQRPDIEVVEPFIAHTSMKPLHESEHEGSRHPDRFREGLEWKGLDPPPSYIILIDDVITSGATFKGCKDLILAHHPDVEVVGVFWARTIWPDEDLTDEGSKE